MTDWAARVLNFKRGELRLALLAALFYFCVLSGYFFLRPVRAVGILPEFSTRPETLFCVEL